MIVPSQWRTATVVGREQAAEDMVAIRLEAREIEPHRPGQHYEVRLPDDELSRKFSIVSGPASLPIIELGVQILPTGLVSPRLARVEPGDRLEIRGPLGRAFVWTPGSGRNLLLLGAGAGITPLLSMWTEFFEEGQAGVCRFVVSAKTADRVYRYEQYRDQLNFRLTATESRLNAADVEAILSGLPRTELAVRICGPSGFISAMVGALIAAGVNEDCIRSEGFA